jgi:hypothetical protein
MKTLTTIELETAKKCYCAIWADPEDERNTHYKLFQYLRDAKKYVKHCWNAKIWLCVNGVGQKRMDT